MHFAQAADIPVVLQQAGPRPNPEKLEEAVRIKHLLAQNTQELSGILNGLEGRYVTAAPGGDLLRDGAGVLPTGQIGPPFSVPPRRAQRIQHDVRTWPHSVMPWWTSQLSKELVNIEVDAQSPLGVAC